MTLSFFADRVDNPANLMRIGDAARLLDADCVASVVGRLIAVENTKGAREIYGRRPLKGHVTLAVGNERRGLSRGTLAQATEIVVIPTQSRKVTTLNVAAAAAVAGWYVIRGSGSQIESNKPEMRLPSVLLLGDDHVEVGSSLRSAAAFGFRDVLLEDRGAGWFDGPSPVRREAFAAARRHKNALRVHRATLQAAAGFDEIVAVVPSGDGVPIQRTRLMRGARQLIVFGAAPDDISAIQHERVRIATLDLQRVDVSPLRLIASIGLAEIARQVGRRRGVPGRPSPRPPRYDAEISIISDEPVLLVEFGELLGY